VTHFGRQTRHFGQPTDYPKSCQLHHCLYFIESKKYVQSREEVCAVARRNMCSRAKYDFDNILIINDLEAIFDTDTY
jgi:hypothetical protein